MKKNNPIHRPLMVIALTLFALVAASAPSAASEGAGLAGTYVVTFPDRSEILQLHQGGTAELILSEQVTSGAGGFTFDDSLGSWKSTGPRRAVARFVNHNFDVTGPAATYSGIAVVDYSFQFSQSHDAIAASCLGKIFAAGDDPLDPTSIPVVGFDCAYLEGFLYHKIELDDSDSDSDSDADSDSDSDSD